MADGLKFTDSDGTVRNTHADDVSYDGLSGPVQRVKVGHGAPGSYVDVGPSTPLPVTDAGTYGYDASNAAGTVNVPAGAKLRRVSVIAGSSAATVKIGTGPTITIPAGGSFDETIAGASVAPAVVIGGTVLSYYVAWVA